MNLNQLNFYFLLFLMFFFMICLIMLIPSNLYTFHPLTLSLMLVIYTVLLTFFLSFFSSIYWYSYILFLVMIGGLMILFMYMTSLSNNQLFYLNMEYYFWFFVKMIMIMLIIMVLFSKFDLMILILNSEYYEILELKLNLKNLNYLNFKNLYMDYIMNINLYMILYLFFTMICSVLICNKIMIPLRQLNKN